MVVFGNHQVACIVTNASNQNDPKELGAEAGTQSP